MAQSMLGTGTMSRTALALVLVAASSSAAFAGGFVGLGIGTGAATSGEFNLDENGRSGRLDVGYRFGRISVEGLGSRYGMFSPDGHEWTGTTLAIAGRYNFPLGDGFEVFPRLGLQHTDIQGNVYHEDMVGSGFLVGGGAEYRLPLTAVGLSVVVDYTIIHSSLKPFGEGPTGSSLTSRMWTLGAILSF
jgi:hypothetical protein